MGTLATYSYNAVGNRTQTQRANGITSTYGYDDLHRLTGIEHKKGSEVLSQLAYTLNNDGKRGTLTEYVKYPESQTVASINRTVHYGYDKAGRLIGEQRQSHQTLAAGGSIDKTAHTVWTYDKANNRLTQHLSNYDGLGTDSPSVLTSTHATQYNYNSNDWLQNQTSEYTTGSTTNTYTTNYEYNGNGSQSAVTTNVGTSDQKRTPYFYDFEEKLIGIGNPADTTKHAYAYDADGNRVTETNYNNGTPTTKHYLVDPNVGHAQVVEEFDSANQLLAHHDWDDTELLRSAVADNEGNAHITHPLADGHNSTRQLMDATGSIGGVLGYDAWGNAQESIGLSTAYRYNSQRLDASGLYHLRARQYTPWTGRFLSHDPVLGRVEDPITQHRYLYGGNDPVNFVDPSGREFDIRFIHGLQVNDYIGAHFLATQPYPGARIADFWKGAGGRIPFKKVFPNFNFPGKWANLRPDLVDYSSHKFFDITDVSNAAKASKIALYQEIFNYAEPGVWSPGEPSDYTPVSVVGPLQGGFYAQVFPPAGGVIFYRKFRTQMPERTPVPIRVPIPDYVSDKIKELEGLESQMSTELAYHYQTVADTILRTTVVTAGVAGAAYGGYQLMTMTGIATMTASRGLM